MQGTVNWTTVLRAILTVVLLGLSLIAVAVGIGVRTGNLNLDPVLSGSMRPTFQPGDLLATWRVRVSSVKNRDVIAFVPPGKTFVEMHRIVNISRDRGKTWVTTRGDANGVNDPWGKVSLRGTTIYRLQAVIPKLGWVATIRRGTLMLALLLPAGILLVISGWKNFKNPQQTTEGVYDA